jgi:protein-S-isoprenylcysteine O-methyltransferase Ste14
MSTPDVSDGNRSNRVSVPRWMALILSLFAWLVVIPIAHGVVPWTISLLTSRAGWTEGHPGASNLLGLMLVMTSAVLLLWVLVVGAAQTPKRVRLGLTPPVLLMRGPYAFTRNSMYLAEMGLWLGWALFYGSVPVLIGFVVFCVVVNVLVVPHEERALEAQFGEMYLQYKETVPRWLGRSRHRWLRRGDS